MPTLSSPLILQRTLAAFRTQFPMIGGMGTDFSDKPLRLNDTVTAHIRVLPGSAAYDPTTGYENGATEGRSLLVDLPITVDKHRHVPLMLSHLNLIKDQKNDYEGALADASWVLGREMIQSILAKFNAGNVSRQLTEAVANWDLETIEQITTGMNEAGCPAAGRIGIINSKVAGQLALDSRITSRDYYGILTGDQPLRIFRGVGGFSALYEFPDLPLNNAATQTFTAQTTDICTATAHGYKNNMRVRLTNSGGALPAGLATATDYYIIYLDADTFKLSATRGGAAVDITGTGTGTHSIVGYENLVGAFFNKSGVAIRAGIPEQTAELAGLLGIPQIMQMDVQKDVETGFMMALMKWQKGGTGTLYASPTAIWGSSIGAQYGGADSITDRACYRVVSA